MLSRRSLLAMLAAVPADAFAREIGLSYAARFTPQGAVDVATVPPANEIGSSLVMAPGFYSYSGTAYDCTVQGLYRWFVFNTDTTNRIAYSGDVYALMSGLAWLCTHGRADEGLTVQQMESRAKTSKLRLRCGPTVSFARYIAAAQGLTTRTVRHLTMLPPVAPWAGVDEGHVTFELQQPSGWVNFDLDNGAYYRDGAGNHVNARDLAATIADNSFQIVPLDADAKYEALPFESGKFDVTGWSEIVFMRENGHRDWVRRILQAVGIDHPNGEIWWLLPAGSESRASWVLGLQANYRVKTLAEFNAAFYP